MQHGRLQLEACLLKTFTSDESINVGNLSVTAFAKFHDAADPYSFFVSCGKIGVGIFTDIGVPCPRLIKYFKQCHAAFLEANYDEEMLEKGSYPIYLKNRIRGGMGHLSNKQALDLFITHKPGFMSHLLLAHLSHNNNSPELVQQLFNSYAENVQVCVASRYRETDVFHICQHSDGENASASHFTGYSSPVQLTLSFA